MKVYETEDKTIQDNKVYVNPPVDRRGKNDPPPFYSREKISFFKMKFSDIS